MCDEWMPHLALELTPEQFQQLPRHAAYKYEYHEATVWVNPRPRFYHARLELPAALDGPASVSLRAIGPGDWEVLEGLFAEAFQGQQPFAGLSADDRRLAARKCLGRTRAGGDGPWIEQASFLATGATGLPVGAVFVTLIPRRDPTDWDSYTWDEPPPPDCIAGCLGRPHLTWIFVRPETVGRGVGTALLAGATEVLGRLGYDELLSTFLLGNDSSMLWHWRAGFRLLTYPGSPRRLG